MTLPQLVKGLTPEHALSMVRYTYGDTDDYVRALLRANRVHVTQKAIDQVLMRLVELM